jgi:hypothetical protein
MVADLETPRTMDGNPSQMAAERKEAVAGSVAALSDW